MFQDQFQAARVQRLVLPRLGTTVHVQHVGLRVLWLDLEWHRICPCICACNCVMFIHRRVVIDVLLLHKATVFRTDQI